MQVSRRAALAGLGVGATFGFPGLTRHAWAADTPVVVPIALDGRVLVACGIDDAGPYFFMIDTGGTMSLIEEALARELKLQVVASAHLHGVGGAATAGVYRARDLSIGSIVRLPQVVFQGVAGAGFGKDVRGTLAAGTVTGYDSVLDFEAGEWRIYRDGFGVLPGFTEVDSALEHEDKGAARIVVVVTIDGQPFRCLVDTGAPGELTLYPEAARRTRLWTDETIPYAPIRARGVGGQGDIGRLVRATRASIGPVVFDRPLVRLDGGTRGQQSTDGVIGLPLIRQFNLATDVRRRRVLVQPNHLAPDRARAPMSGLWIDRRGDALVVGDVGRGSPAAAVGIKPGDIITGTDFASLIRMLGGRPGASVALTIDRGGQAMPVKFALAEYL